eukprot:TRINITY_DN10168_c0_g1_i1.p1 TRINITY_DN10168_c0_g1~~TRINITY_DN10168_c0_g1_i1.p1  ORF type:complete len:1353 (+),score=249.67 TRINITY_DN10168_c0_g1_i1:99-4157(+)
MWELLTVMQAAHGQFPWGGGGGWPTQFPTSPPPPSGSGCSTCECANNYEPYTLIQSGTCQHKIASRDDCRLGCEYMSSTQGWFDDSPSDINSNSWPEGCVAETYNQGSSYYNRKSSSTTCSSSVRCVCNNLPAFTSCTKIDGNGVTGYAVHRTALDCSGPGETEPSQSECQTACQKMGAQFDQSGSWNTVPRGCYLKAGEEKCYFNSESSPSCVSSGSCSDPNVPDEARFVICKITQCSSAVAKYCGGGAPPTSGPAAQPTASPTASPLKQPTASPLKQPTASPLKQPTAAPLKPPTMAPSTPPNPAPSATPSARPSTSPTKHPIAVGEPSSAPRTSAPSRGPSTSRPTASPSVAPSRGPTATPETSAPTAPPTNPPTVPPASLPTTAPTEQPQKGPTAGPAAQPTTQPSARPTVAPFKQGTPSKAPVLPPTRQPTGGPSTSSPTVAPSGGPTTRAPTRGPSARPSRGPAGAPTSAPLTSAPSAGPSGSPVTSTPTRAPVTSAPTRAPATSAPSPHPSLPPTAAPSGGPTTLPPTRRPSATPSLSPSTSAPTQQPTVPPSTVPTAPPSVGPSTSPQLSPTTPPSQHPCSTDQHGCDTGPGGVCTPKPVGWECGCADGYHCVKGCGPISVGHKCEKDTGAPTAAPSRTPSRTPSRSPQLPPTLSPVRLPTVSPVQAPTVATAAPTAPPTAAPTAVGGLAEKLSATAAEKKEALKAAPLATLAATSAATSTVVGLAAAGNAGKLAALANIDCVLDDVDLGEKPLDWEFHPLGKPIGDHSHRYFLGAVVYNPLIVLCFLGALLTVILVMTYGLGNSFAHSAGTVKCPGLCYLPVMFLLQGTSLAASNMAFNPGKAPTYVAIIGVCVLAGSLGLLGFLWFTILRPLVFCARVVPDPRLAKRAAPGQPAPLVGKKRKLYKFLFGEYIWVSTPSKGGRLNDKFVEQLGLFFESYRATKQWFVLAEMGNMISLSILAVIPVHSTTACHLRNSGISVLLGGFLWLVARCRPYQSQLDNLVSMFMALLMFFAVLFSSIAIIIGEPGDTVDVLLIAAADLLLVSAILLMVKACYDFLLYLYDVKISRRAGVRRGVRMMDGSKQPGGRLLRVPDSMPDDDDEEMRPLSTSARKPGSMMLHPPMTPMSPDSVYMPSGSVSPAPAAPPSPPSSLRSSDRMRTRRELAATTGSSAFLTSPAVTALDASNFALTAPRSVRMSANLDAPRTSSRRSGSVLEALGPRKASLLDALEPTSPRTRRPRRQRRAETSLFIDSVGDDDGGGHEDDVAQDRKAQTPRARRSSADPTVGPAWAGMTPGGPRSVKRRPGTARREQAGREQTGREQTGREQAGREQSLRTVHERGSA